MIYETPISPVTFNIVSVLLEENGSHPATFILGDITTFKVVVQNADVMDIQKDVIEKDSSVIVNVTDNNDDVIEDDIDAEFAKMSRRNQILSLMSRDKRISVKQIAKKMGVTSRTIFREIDILKAEGLLKREGSDRGGTWVVIS